MFLAMTTLCRLCPVCLTAAVPGQPLRPHECLCSWLELTPGNPFCSRAARERQCWPSWGSGKRAQQGGSPVGNSRDRAVTGAWAGPCHSEHSFGQGLVTLNIPLDRLGQNSLSPITEQLHYSKVSLHFFFLQAFYPFPFPFLFFYYFSTLSFKKTDFLTP